MINFENWLENEIDIESLRDFTDKVIVECCKYLEDYSDKFDVSIFIVDDEQIQKINLEYRAIDKSTDVLSFPMNEMKDGKCIANIDIDESSGNAILGDIIISLPTCYRQAEEYGHSFEREFAFLLSHGMMHLLGFDHIDEKDAKVMFENQEQVLSNLGITRDI